MASTEDPTTQPPVINYILSFLLVGIAWGFTTPFIRRAAADFNARQDASTSTSTSSSPSEQTPPTVYEDNETPLNPIDPPSSEPHTTTEDENEVEEEAEEEDNPPPTQPAWMRQPPHQKTWVRTKLTSIFWTVVNLLRTPAYSIPLVVNLTGSVWFFLLVGKHELSLTVPLANSSAFLFTVLGEWYVERKGIARETWVGMALVLGGIAVCVFSKS
ncbi:uncharacterized protein BO97DRAFT_394408 [Aspergillus homomorphus CBS 101889]|uniref:Integral membrane protein n=1 Tax=Aspergillus homomorphus (strain CBS 101889) TaxID=1450537 RepID=A0A395HVQ1_ASPHC|nr:hypothetical protein BO97DRAFT_394408 [Aspergillus homomorphus CBS 101889]RAL10294.1 hypothetical protein BO97DRAFT_394408 [Aspergillus homomorphus CBS 101889]